MKFCILVLQTSVIHFFAPSRWCLVVFQSVKAILGMHEIEYKLRQGDTSCPEYCLWELVNTGCLIIQILEYFSVKVNFFYCVIFFSFSAFVGYSCADMILSWWRTLNWPSNLSLALRGVHEKRATTNLISLRAVTFWCFLRIKTAMRKEMR